MVRDGDEPTLTSAEIDDLMAGARRPDKYGVRIDTYLAWRANLALVVGDLVVPSTRNGHYYRVTVSDGAAGTTEPTWPTTSAVTVTADGVTYAEAGTASWTATWDLNWAAAEGWSQKAGKVAGQFSFSTDRQSFNRNEVFAMCERQRDYYRKKISSSEPLSAGAWRRSYVSAEEDLLP